MTRQRERLLEHADTFGGTVDPDVDCYYDDDITAKGGQFRPGLESLLAAVVDGQYDGILVWEFSRWTRNRRDNRTMTDLLKQHGCELHSYREPWITVHGRIGFLLTWAAELAAVESERIAARVTDWHRQKATIGAVHTVAPFGMRKAFHPSPWPDRVAPIAFLEPDHDPRTELGGHSPAQLTTAAFEMAAQRISPLAIATQWNNHGYPSPRGKTWTSPVIERLLANHQYTGRATFKGQPLTDADGTPLTPHTPLITPDLFNKVQAIRDARPRHTLTPSPLRGLFRCGTCGNVMGWATTKRTGRNTYRCAKPSPSVCPARNAIAGHDSVAYVFEAVTEVLADPEKLHALLARNGDTATAAVDAARATLERTQRALARLEADHAAGQFADRLGENRYHKLRSKLQQTSDQASATIARMERRLPSDYRDHLLESAGDVRTAISAMPPARRRHLVTQLVDHVIVHPLRGNRRRRWDPARLEIVWRTN